jgi:hypothetical protein
MKRWTFEEEKYLLDNIKTCKIADIGKKLHKSTITVKQKLRRLKVSKGKKCDYPGIFWNKWDKMWIIYYYEDSQVWELGQYKTLNDAKEAIFRYKVLKMCS